jgi:uncharacterized protein YbjT (DUF2867 family)
VFRSEEKAEPYREKYPNLEIVTGVDANKPETMVNAYRGAQAALVVTPHDMKAGFSRDAELTEAMINSAVENGVQYIVYVGSFTVNNYEGMKHIASRFQPTEVLLEKLGKEKGLKWTVLRAGNFMENLLPNFKKIKDESVYTSPKFIAPMVDTKDIGRSGAACLAAGDFDKHHGKKYEISGPVNLNPQDIANIFGKVLGKEIKYNEMTKEMVLKFMPPAFAKFTICLIEKPGAVPLSDDVKNLTGQNSDFESFVRNHMSAFNGSQSH